MSVQKSSYTSKKTGKTTVRYYANVWNPAEKRSVIGPMRSTEKLARQDEAGSKPGKMQRTAEYFKGGKPNVQ